MEKPSLDPLKKLLAPYLNFYPLIVVYSLSISLLTLATPISVQSLVSTFSFGPLFQPIALLALILLVLLIVLGIIKCFQYLLVEHLQRKLFGKMAATISHAYSQLDDNPNLPLREMPNRYFDIIIVHKKLAFLVTDGVNVVLQTIIALILVSLYHPFFLVFGLVIMVAMILPVYLFGSTALNSALGESNEKYRLAGHLDRLSKDLALDETATLQESDHYIGRYLDKRRRHFNTLFLQNIIYIIQYAVLNALLLALGGYLVISNQLTLGQLVAAEIMVNFVLGHFFYAAKYLESFYDMYAAALKIYPFYESSNKALSRQGGLSGDMLFEASSENPIFQKFESIQKVPAPRQHKKTLRNFTLGTLALALFLSLVPWYQFSRAKGRVVAFNPNDRVQEITAPLEGIVEEWLVQDGQSVKKGDPIVRVIDNDPQYILRLEENRDAAVAKFEAAKEATNTGRLNFHRQEKLVKEGLSSRKEFEAAKIKYKKLQAEEASAVSSLAKAETSLSRQQQQQVIAPRDGLIRRILVGSGTTNVKEGQPLVEFVPKTSGNAVELFIDGNDLPLIHKGRKVRLQFEGWPAVQFSGWPAVAVGSFGGVVSNIDPSVSNDGTFRILVSQDPESSPSWPDSRFLRQGARAVGIVSLDRVTLGYEFWRQINGFPKSMDMAPESDSTKMKGKK